MRLLTGHVNSIVETAYGIMAAKLERPMSVESAIPMADYVQAREYNSVRIIREIGRGRGRLSDVQGSIPRGGTDGQQIFDIPTED